MKEDFNKRKYVAATLDRIEGTTAVFQLDNGQKLNWPVANLPADLEEGGQVKLVLFTDKDEQEEREEMAKAVLNEILKTE